MSVELHYFLAILVPVVDWVDPVLPINFGYVVVIKMAGDFRGVMVLLRENDWRYQKGYVVIFFPQTSKHR